jgi:hypothetical protein
LPERAAPHRKSMDLAREHGLLNCRANFELDGCGSVLSGVGMSDSGGQFRLTPPSAE